MNTIRIQNITCENMEIYHCDGDAMVVRDSNIVNIDAGEYERSVHASGNHSACGIQF